MGLFQFYLLGATSPQISESLSQIGNFDPADPKKVALGSLAKSVNKRFGGRGGRLIGPKRMGLSILPSYTNVGITTTSLATGQTDRQTTHTAARTRFSAPADSGLVSRLPSMGLTDVAEESFTSSSSYRPYRLASCKPVDFTVISSPEVRLSGSTIRPNILLHMY